MFFSIAMAHFKPGLDHGPPQSSHLAAVVICDRKLSPRFCHYLFMRKIGAIIGLKPEFIGLTVVAFGTSMPELATSAVAALRRQPEVAVGNVADANIF